MTRPATISRRGFLRALGITATTVLLGDVVKVEADVDVLIHIPVKADGPAHNCVTWVTSWAKSPTSWAASPALAPNKRAPSKVESRLNTTS